MAETERARLLRAKEAAEILAISPNKLWAMTKAGEIPCIRFGRAVRYDPDDLCSVVKRFKQNNNSRRTVH